MSVGADTEPTLSPHTIAILESEGLLTNEHQGKRRIALHIVQEDAGTEHSECLSSWSTSFYEFELESRTIPSRLYSSQTYEILGFDRQTAAKLWELATDDVPNAPPLAQRFLETARHYIMHFEKRGAKGFGADPERWLKRIGINGETKNLVLDADPEGGEVCSLKTLTRWVRETMEVRWLGLLDLERHATEGLERWWRKDERQLNEEGATLW